jgi:hypothetical protein
MAQLMQHSPEEVCRDVYKKVDALYKSMAEKIKIDGKPLGFRVLYGPPKVDAEFVFIGYQPGGGHDSWNEEQHREWPADPDYALDQKQLACRGYKNTKLVDAMQYVWDASVLRRCTGLNTIFFRYPSKKRWERDIDPETRRDIAHKCKDYVQQIILALGPRRLVIMGLETFSDLLLERIPLRFEHSRHDGRSSCTLVR